MIPFLQTVQNRRIYRDGKWFPGTGTGLGRWAGWWLRVEGKISRILPQSPCFGATEPRSIQVVSVQGGLRPRAGEWG